ncbi:MAG: Nucleoside-diphosphate-sugar epimerase, partial [Parcubacteria group bacterium GW2011_GWA1_38_7]
MTYFITGGSGFLGINMVRFLLKNGHEIISYDLLPFDYPEKNKVRWVMGDIRNLEFLTESMKGTDIVIHMAANTDTSS